MKEKRKNEQAKKDYYSSVLLSQIICSVLVLILFFSVKNSAGAECFLEAYSALLEPDFFSEKAESTFSAVKEYIFNENSSFAVSGSKVVPYEETTVSESTAAEEITETPEESTKAVFASENVSEISLSYKTEKADEMLLLPEKREGIIFPVEEGRFTSYFGERTDPLSSEEDYHGGVDIGADEGDRIRAVYDGIVSCVGYDDISGNYIFLSHKNGYETFYCHCSEIIADEGAVIRQGETIALVGSTGYSTGPHLHFEIRFNGESIDPMPFLENAS